MPRTTLLKGAGGPMEFCEWCGEDASLQHVECKQALRTLDAKVLFEGYLDLVPKDVNSLRQIA